MVDGVNGQNPTQQTLKLKGPKGQTVDLGNLKGLRQTDANKSIFDLINSRMEGAKNDGIIDEKETAWLQEQLAQAAKPGKDNTLSRKEVVKAFGKENKVAFDALTQLAKQQSKIASGEEFIEEQQDGSQIHASKEDSYIQKTEENGDVVKTYSDGTKEITHKDGSQETHYKDGSYIKTDPQGRLIDTYDNDSGTGQRIEYTADNKTITTEYAIKKDAEGNVTGTVDGNRTFTEETENGSTDTIYGPESSPEKRPLSKIEYDQDGNPIAQHSYEYDEYGNTKTTTLKIDGTETTTVTDANGNTVDADKFGVDPDVKSNTPQETKTHDVVKGDTLWKIAKKYLPAGKTVLEFLKEIIAANPQIKNPDLIYVGDKVVIPGQESAEKPTEEPTPPTPPTPPAAPVKPNTPIAIPIGVTDEAEEAPKTEIPLKENKTQYSDARIPVAPQGLSKAAPLARAEKERPFYPGSAIPQDIIDKLKELGIPFEIIKESDDAIKRYAEENNIDGLPEKGDLG